jgi:endonuclease YncB( thermonuclease family)
LKIVALLLIWCCAGASAETFTAKVIAVIDGDTVIVQQGNKKTTVRLTGIDAPEKTQPFGPASRAALQALVLRKEVRVITKAIDDYGRTVGIVEAGGLNVNEEQLRRGMAWEYSHFHADKALIALQAEAQRTRMGLWSQANPQPPWEFRKSQAGAEQASAKPGCGNKRYCSQMASCEEAKFYLVQCGLKKLDKNGDGLPCESLCKPKLQ